MKTPIQTRDAPRERRDWKLRIAQGLHECDYDSEMVQELMKLLDWLMELPDALQRNFERRLGSF